MGAGAASEVEMTSAAVAEQPLQAQYRLALGLVVDVGAEQVVVGRQVGVEGGGGHRRGSGLETRARILVGFCNLRRLIMAVFPRVLLT